MLPRFLEWIFPMPRTWQRAKDIESLFFDATGRELGKNRRLNLGELLTFINVLSHRPIRAEEIVKNSKTLMKIIEDIDKVHFNEMKK